MFHGAGCVFKQFVVQPFVLIERPYYFANKINGNHHISDFFFLCSVDPTPLNRLPRCCHR